MLGAYAESLSRAGSQDDLFSTLCGKLCAEGGYRMAWVGLAEEDANRTVRPVASAGFEAGYLQAIDVSWADVELGRGPTGTAIRERRPVVNRAFTADSRMAPWRDEATARGYLASIALPITASEHRCLGALTIYSNDPAAFGDAEVSFLAELAEHLSFGVRALGDRAALVAADERLRTALDASGVGIVELDLEREALYLPWLDGPKMNGDLRPTRETAALLLDRMHPDDRNRVQGAFFAWLAAPSASHQEEFRLLSPEGTWRWIFSTVRVVEYGADGAPRRLLGTHTDITHRKESEAELLESEERYRSLFDGGISAMVIVDPETARIVSANRAAATLYGYPQDRLCGMTIAELSKSSTAALARPLHGHISGELKQIEARHRLADGTIRDIEILTGPIRLGGRQLLHAVLLDITERKRDREALTFLARRSEALVALPRLAELGDDEIFMQRALWIVQELTESPLACLQMLDEEGQTTEVIAAVRPAPEVDFRGAFAEQRAPEWAQKLREGKIVVLNARGVDSDRGGLPELDRLVVVPVIESGRVAMLASLGNKPVDYSVHDSETAQLFANDIWRIVQARRAEGERRKLALAVEQSPDSIVITNLAAEIEYANEAFTRNTGYDRAEALGQNPRFLQSGNTPRARFEEMWATLTRGDTWQGELHNRRRDGSELIERVIMSPIRQPDGRVTHYVAVKRDVTEDKRLAEELERHRHHLEELVQTRTAELAEARQRAEEANAAKSAFLAKMSHEIRTPMNAMIGFAQLLRADGSLSPQQSRHVDTILRSGDHLLTLINDILEMSRIEAGQVKTHIEAFDLHALLADVEAMFRLAAATKGLTLVVERQSSVPRWVKTDAGKLRQVLVNLIGNAVKFTARGGVVVVVRTDETATRLVAEVRDTGPGIPESSRRRLFRPFEQGEGGQRAGGTGLGLAISREFVKLLGGEIRVSSVVGEGASFRFDLPIQVASPGSAAPPPRSARILRVTPSKTAPRVLVVDDEATNRDLLREILGRLGFPVREAADGPTARASFAEWRPDVILMDLYLPGESGVQTIRRIRALPSGLAVRIIACTASVFPETRTEAMSAGADAFLTKPFLEADLLREVQTLTGVEYVEAGPPAQEAPLSQRGAALTRSGLAEALPRSLLVGLGDATRAADLERLLELLGELESRAPAVAQALRAHAERFEYEALLDLFGAGVPTA